MNDNSFIKVMATAMIIIDNNNTSQFMAQIALRDAAIKAESQTKPKPFRLVMIKCQDFCQFCEDPKGPVYNHYINYPETHMGFLSCKPCYEKGQEAVKDWFDTVAYGMANSLRGKTFKVMRSSGEIESDWKLDESKPFVQTIEFEDYVACEKADKTIKKYCKISDLYKWNDLYDLETKIF